MNLFKALLLGCGCLERRGCRAPHPRDPWGFCMIAVTGRETTTPGCPQGVAFLRKSRRRLFQPLSSPHQIYHKLVPLRRSVEPRAFFGSSRNLLTCMTRPERENKTCFVLHRIKGKVLATQADYASASLENPTKYSCVQVSLEAVPTVPWGSTRVCLSVLPTALDPVLDAIPMNAR